MMLEKCDPIGKPVPLKMDGAAILPPKNQAMSSFNSRHGNQARSSSSGGPVSASVAVPEPNPPVNAHVPPSEFNHAVSLHAYCNSLSNNVESRRCNSLDPQPQYSRSESNIGLTSINENVSPPHASYQQMNPVTYNQGLAAQTEAFARVIPIAYLNPHQARWTIKARVTAKGELRHFDKPGGDGKVFSFELLDSDGGEIKVTCFNTVANQFYNQIEQGKVYLISKGSVRPARKSYNHLCNDYEIFLENTSVIQPRFEDDNLVPKMKFKFRPINEIQGIEKEGIVDVMGVASSISPSVPVFLKNGTEIQKRTLQLKDMSGMSIDITLWGDFCNKEGHTLHTMCDSGAFPVLAIKSCKVNDYKGKSLGTISSSQLFIEPDFPEAHKLKAWLERDEKSTPSISVSSKKMNMDMIHRDVHKTISQIKNEQIGTSEKPDWITVCATLTFIKADNIVYSACPIMVGDRKCHKKVTRIGDGKWKCDRCCHVVDECEYRYALQFQIQDHTGFAWVTGFEESGEDIFGVPARDLYCLKYEEKDDDKFAEILHFARFRKYLFKLRVKEETFGDEQRVKSTAFRVEKVNFASDTKYLFNLISKLKAQSGAFSAGPFNSTSGSGMLGTPNAVMKYGGSSGSIIKEHAPSAYLAGPNGNQSNVSTHSSTVMYLRCSSCGGTGHSLTNCPSAMNPHGQCHGGNVGNRAIGETRGRPVASTECFKCRQVGHWAKDCPTMNNLPPADANITPTKYGIISRQQLRGS